MTSCTRSRETPVISENSVALSVRAAGGMGAGYIFQRDARGNWTEVAVLANPDTAGSQFGAAALTDRNDIWLRLAEYMARVIHDTITELTSEGLEALPRGRAQAAE